MANGKPNFRPLRKVCSGAVCHVGLAVAVQGVGEEVRELALPGPSETYASTRSSSGEVRISWYPFVSPFFLLLFLL